MQTLEAKIRNESAREVRESGSIPAVVYGKDVPSTSVTVSASDFTRLFREVGENHVFTLKFGKDTHPVLIHEIQKHPVTGKALHLDFLTVDMKAVVHIEIPVKLIGISPAVLEGGQVHQNLHAVHVKCLPSDIIDAFELDISSIDHIGKVLHVSDLVVDTKKYQLLSHKEEAIVSVHAVREVVEEVAPVSVDDVAVTTEKKQDEESPAA